MRVLLVGMGSRGDVQPFVALGEALSSRGYAVSIAAAGEFRDLVLGRGLDFEPLSFDLRAGIESDIGREWLGGSSTNQVREARLMRGAMRHVATELADDLERLVGSADAVVSSALTFDAVELLAAATRTRHIHATFQPVWPSAFGESSTFALRPVSRSVLNLGWSWLAAQAAWWVVRSTGDVLRRRRGLPQRTMLGYAAAARRTPTLLAASPIVVPAPPDWPASIRQTGFWFPAASDPSDPSGPSAVDPALRAFVDEGPAPVYLGFGCMPTGNPIRVVSAFGSALRRTGRRGVVSSGWADLGAVPLPVDVLAVEAVPHDWLFPRCAAVVHHGGAGTTAAALRAGTPQVVVPHIADQPYWGRRVAELGVGSAPLPRKHFDADRLGRSVEMALSPAVTSAARDLGARMRAENGADEAANLVHELLAGAR